MNATNYQKIIKTIIKTKKRHKKFPLWEFFILQMKIFKIDFYGFFVKNSITRLSRQNSDEVNLTIICINIFFRNIFKKCPHKWLCFAKIEKFKRMRKIRIFPKFYFHKKIFFLFFGDEVNFSASHAKIFLQNFVSFGFKKPRSDILARIADVFGSVCHLIK